MEAQEATQIDPKEADAFMSKVITYTTGAVLMPCIILGDKLGLFEGMAKRGPTTSWELAADLELKERWVREWLCVMASSGLISYAGDNKFFLSPIQKATWTNEKDSPMFYVGGALLYNAAAQKHVIEATERGFRTGEGCNYDGFGTDMSDAIARLEGPWRRHYLVDKLKLIDGLTDKLNAGAKVADIGCGAGEVLMILARAFPNSSFHGYELSKVAVELANQRLAEEEENVRNAVHFHDINVEGEQLPQDHSFDFVISLDILHDMTDPLSAIRLIRGAIKEDGVWLSVEPCAEESFDENLRKNPFAAFYYGISLFVCMSSALAASDGKGAGMGAMGYTPSVAKKMCVDEAGFGSVKVHPGQDFENPFSFFYEVRP